MAQNFLSDIHLADDLYIRIGDSSDLFIYHEAGGASWINNYTSNLHIRNNADDGDIIFSSDDGSGGIATYYTIDGGNEVNLFSKNVKLSDSVELRVGDSNDLKILHNGTDSYVQNFTGDLQIQNQADDKDILFRCDDGNGGVATYFYLDGDATNVRFSRKAKFSDNVEAVFGDGADLKIYHDGTNNQIRNEGGSLDFEQHVDDGTIRFYADNGSGGVARYFYVDGSTERIQFDKQAYFVDSAKATFGAGEDLQIYHDGSNSYITEQGTGNLFIEASDNIYFRNTARDEYYAQFTVNGAVKLRYDNVVKFETTSAGATITGALSITGDGSNAVTLTESGGGDFTIDAVGDIAIDADGGDIRLKDGSVGTYGAFTNTSSHFEIRSSISDKDIIFKGNDAGSVITALTLDMSEGGAATFAGNISVNGAGQKAVLHVKNESNNWEDGVLLEHDSGDTGWNIHPENNSDNALWFGYNSDTSVALTSQAATTALKLNSDLSATFTGRTDLQKDLRIRGNDSSGSLGVVRFFTDSNNVLSIDTGNDGSNRTEIDGSGNATFGGALVANLTNGKWRVNTYGAMYFRNSSNATHESYIHSRSDGSLSIGRVAESDWTGTGNGAYAATTYDHLTFDTSSNATFAGNIRLTTDIGRDDHNRIMFSTDDSIIYRVADSHRFRMNSDNFSPYVDSSYDLGTSSLYFRAAYIDAITTTGNVTVGGDLTVNGTTTTVNQTNLDVSDNIIGLNRGAGSNANDSGIIIERGSTGDNAAFLWDESIGYFSFGTTQETASSTGAIANESDWTWKPIKASGAVYTGGIYIGGTTEMTGYAYIAERIVHTGDTDTYLRFVDNNPHFFAGGVNVLDLQASETQFTGDLFTFTSANSTDPLVNIKNTTNDANGARLRFTKDKGAAGADDDVVGQIEFVGDNAAQELTEFAKIQGSIETAADGTEGGRLRLGVASHDGEMRYGLVLHDGDAEDEIDVSIGGGAASVTTVAGDLSIYNKLTFRYNDNHYLQSGTNNWAFKASSGSVALSLTTGGAAEFAGNISVPQTKKILFDGQSGHTYLAETSDSNLKIYVAGTETVNISNDQFNFNKPIGIGAACNQFHDDADDLVVGNGTGNTGMTIQSGTSGYGSIFFADGTADDATEKRGQIRYLQGTETMDFHTDNVATPVLTLGATGVATFTNATASGTAMYIRNYTNAIADTKTLIDFRVQGSDNSPYYVAGQMGSKAEGTWTSTSSSRDASLIFNTVLNGNNELALTLASDKKATFEGDVRINGNDLEFNGAAAKISGTSGGQISLNYNTTSNQPLIWYGGGTSEQFKVTSAGDATFAGDLTLDDNSGASPSLYLKNGNNNFWRLFCGSSEDLTFRLGTVTKLEIDSSGNATFAGNIALGGGTLKTYHSNVTSVIALDDNGSIFTRADETYIGHNIYYDSGDDGTAIEDGYSTLLRLTEGEFYIYGTAASVSADATTSIQERFKIDTSGDATFAGDVIMSNSSGSTLNINSALGAADSKILLHEGSTASPANGASIRYDGVNNLFKIGVGTNVDTTRLTIARDTGNATFAGSVTINSDTGKLYLGADDDLHVYHTGSHGYVLNKTGALYIMSQVQDGNIVFANDDGAGGSFNYFSVDGGSTTHDGSTTTAAYTKWYDKSRIALGTGKDLQLYHDGTNNFITSGAVGLYVQGDYPRIQSAAGENYFVANPNAEVNLYYDNSKKFETTSTGIEVTGHVDMDTGNSSGKFAVMSGAVHASYDFYNNGTSYFNGAVTVDDALTMSGTNAQINLPSLKGVRLHDNTTQVAFELPYFTHATADLAADIILGNHSIYGILELTLTAGYSHQNAVGEYKFKWILGVNANNSVWYTPQLIERRVTHQNQIYVADPAWDSTNSRYYIRVYHKTSTGNNWEGHLKYTSLNATASNFMSNLSISGLLTSTSTANTHPVGYFLSDQTGDMNLILQSKASGDPTLTFNSEAANRNGIINFQDQGTTTGAIQYLHNGDIMKFITGGTGTNHEELTLNETAGGKFRTRLAVGGDNPGDRAVYVTGSAAILELESTTANNNASVWFRSNVSGTSADRWEIGTNISTTSSFELYNRAASQSAFNIDSSNNTNLATTQGSITTIGPSTASTTSKQGRLKLRGKNNYSDGSTWYGDYGELEFLTSTNMTSSARGYLMTNAYMNNRFAFIQSSAADTSPVVSSTSASQLDNGNLVFDVDNSRHWTFHSPLIHLNGSTTDYMLHDGTYFKFVTSDGYIQIGPANSSYCHIQTDRARFYMNKRLIVDEGIIGSYNEDLILRRADDSSYQMTLSTTAATFTHDVVAFSDKKLKKNIKTLDGSKVYDMRGVSFTRKDNGEDGSGVIAQEIQKVAPELVNETDGTLGVSYGNITGYLIEAIKDLKAEIEELKKCNKCNDCNCK